jgi:hypothetical protein
LAVFRVDGTSAGVFSWFAQWDSVTNDLTIDASGSGRSSVTVAQSNGQARTVGFVQQAGDTPISPLGWPAPTLVVMISDPPTVIPNITLKPSPNAKDGNGGFVVENETWSRI